MKMQHEFTDPVVDCQEVQACVSLIDSLLHLRIHFVVFGVFGVGENQLPSKVVVGANNIYHVGNVTILPLRFSASSLFFCGTKFSLSDKE